MTDNRDCDMQNPDPSVNMLHCRYCATWWVDATSSLVIFEHIRDEHREVWAADAELRQDYYNWIEEHEGKK